MALLHWFVEQIRRIRYLLSREEFDSRMREEMRLHIDLRTEENRAAGLTEYEAARRASVRFGNTAMLREESREVFMLRQIDAVGQDLKYAFRMIRRSPGFAAIVVMSLALGIGANTAIFSLVNAALLRSLPVKDPGKLVVLSNDTSFNFSSPVIQIIVQQIFSYPAYTDFRDRNQVLSGIAVVRDGTRISATIDGKNEVAKGLVASGSYFSVLGIDAALGRLLTDDDDRTPGAHPVTVISYGYWQRRFGGDPSIIGKDVVLNGTSFKIIGVTPKRFYGLDVSSAAPDFTVPMMMQSIFESDPKNDNLTSASAGWLQIIGRLKPGVTSSAAAANLDIIYHQSQEEARAQSAKSNGGQNGRDRQFSHLYVNPGSKGLSFFRQLYGNPLLVLLGAVGLVLLIACANVASLLLARSTARQKEIAVRSALGAGRARLVRQLLTESVLLSVIGGALGIIFCLWGTGFLLKAFFTDNEVPSGLKPNAEVLLFTLMLSVLTGLVFGLAPAFRSSRLTVATALKDSASNLSARAGRSRLAKALVMGQVALSLLLLVGAGLFLRTLQKLESVNLGFQADGVLIANLDPSLAGYNGERLKRLFVDLVDSARTIPGAEKVAASDPSPISGGESISDFGIPGVESDPDNSPSTHVTWASPGYFDAMGIQMTGGRDFNPRDSAGAPFVGVINKEFAQRYFDGRDPIGQKIEFGHKAQPRIVEIVGLVADSKYTSIQEAAIPMVYEPLLQSDGNASPQIIVRTAASPDLTTPLLRDAIHRVDPNLPIVGVHTLRFQVDDSLSQQKLIASLCSFFAFFALLLACIGLYGVISYSVAQRTSEIGVRMALGASSSSVLWLVVKETLLIVCCGSVIGLGVSVAFSRILSSMLFSVKPTDQLTLTAATTLLSLVALAAGFLPARRASRVDPLVALRWE